MNYTKLRNEINNKLHNPISQWKIHHLNNYWSAIAEIIGKENIPTHLSTIAKAIKMTLKDVKLSYVNHQLDEIPNKAFSMWSGYEYNDKRVLKNLPIIAKAAGLPLKEVKEVWYQIVAEMKEAAEEQRADAVATYREQQYDY